MRRSPSHSCARRTAMAWHGGGCLRKCTCASRSVRHYTRSRLRFWVGIALSQRKAWQALLARLSRFIGQEWDGGYAGTALYTAPEVFFSFSPLFALPFFEGYTPR